MKTEERTPNQILAEYIGLVMFDKGENKLDKYGAACCNTGEQSIVVNGIAFLISMKIKKE